LALNLKIFTGRDVSQGQLFLPLLNADVQSVQILNDASRVRWRFVRPHTTFVVVAVRALIIIERELLWMLADLLRTLQKLPLLALFLKGCIGAHCLLSGVVL
jgi:hypothetical protein